MKIYTKTGDAGETSLYGGGRRSKADRRVAAYGEVDELQAALGVALSQPGVEEGVEVILEEVQFRCFALSSQLATLEAKEGQPGIGPEDIAWLEEQIDRLDAQLPVLRSFIMLGGSPLGAHLHLARTVCRRAERAVVELAAKEGVEPLCLRYLNRLSDLLFVLARTVNHRAGQPEKPWKWLSSRPRP